jgi:hypothetical protein
MGWDVCTGKATEHSGGWILTQALLVWVASGLPCALHPCLQCPELASDESPQRPTHSLISVQTTATSSEHCSRMPSGGTFVGGASYL